MTTPSPIPVYPPNSADLLRLLLSREKARLLGPVVTQAVLKDESRASERAQEKALEELEWAEKWVERAGAALVMAKVGG